MAWETRNGHGSYYTRSRKVAGRVVREYGGAGWRGESLEMIDQIDRMRRENDRRDLLRWRAPINDAYALLDAYCRIVEAIAREQLLSAGYHQHHRGEWRRKRAQAA